VLWSIVMVEFVHPVSSSLDFGDCERCSRGFDSVRASTLTLFQTLVASDAWGQVAIPVIEHYPPTFIFFFLLKKEQHLFSSYINIYTS